MKKIILTISVILAFATMAIAGPWSTSCVFQTDNTCTFNMSPQAGFIPGFGVANLFVPATASSGSTTLTIGLSHDNTTYYSAYSTNTTAYDVYTGSTTVNKSYGMYLDGAYYIRLTASDNAFNGSTIRLQGRY